MCNERHALVHAKVLAPDLPIPYDDGQEDCSMARKTVKKLKQPAPRDTGGARRASRSPSNAGFVTEVRRKLGLSRRAFSRLTGFSERAIANWESGAKPDLPGMRRIRETERFQQRLGEIVQPEAIPEWLDTPNDAFDGLKPLEVIERGEIDRLWNMIFYLESGVAS
jgi:DNA-binding transcriptional regulator YiaG